MNTSQQKVWQVARLVNSLSLFFSLMRGWEESRGNSQLEEIKRSCGLVDPVTMPNNEQTELASNENEREKIYADAVLRMISTFGG
jgi:hypothetical protein